MILVQQRQMHVFLQSVGGLQLELLFGALAAADLFYVPEHRRSCEIQQGPYLHSPYHQKCLSSPSAKAPASDPNQPLLAEAL